MMTAGLMAPAAGSYRLFGEPMPIFDELTLIRLLGSIEAGRLVVLCGAGLSIPQPSNLMSAQRVARVCYDKWIPIQQLPVAMRDDVAPPTLNLTDPSEGCLGIDLVPLKARERPIRAVLSNSFGFGGTNASLVFREFH